MRNRILLTLLIILFVIPTMSFSQDISNYLILEDIGPYKISKPEKLFPGELPIGGPRTYDSHGIIGATGHFPDHTDKTYTVMYLGETDDLPSPTVQVTQHIGSDSDKWLLHEVDRDFRTYYGLPGRAYSHRQIDGHTVLKVAAGGRNYRWVSGNKVIMIEYHDSQLSKPEPIEVVKAYLSKHPSTLQYMSLTELRSEENKMKWIKDEMDRRLWLGDKWIARIETVGNLNELGSVVKSLNVFLDYREKYYGIEVATEKQTLSEYLLAKNQAGIKTKLEEYKTWWATNKDKAISIQ